MSDIINHLLPAIEHFRILSYWIVLLVAFAESLAFVGLLVPGSTIIVMAGFLSARGFFDLGDLIWFAAVGAILGDGISFYLGKRPQKMFRPENKIFKVSRLEQAEAFFKKHGGKSVFLGRFGPLRAIIPFVAGMSSMPTRSFFFWNVLSALAWAVTHLLLGYFFGQAWKTVETWSTRLSILFIALMLGLIGIYWLKSVIFRRGRQFFAFLGSILSAIKTALIANPAVKNLVRRYPAFFRFLHARLRTDRFSGIPLSLLVAAFLVTLALLLGVVEDLLTSDPIVAVDVHLQNLLYAFRNPVIVQYFLWITLLGKWVIVSSVAAVVGAILWLARKRVYILPFWFGLIGSSLFDLLGKFAFHRPRPEFGVYVEPSFSFPSGHATIAVACYGFITYVLWQQLDAWQHKLNVLFGGIGIILAIGLSRMYLGVHFLSDVWGGYLLGLLWLIIGISLVEWQIAHKSSALQAQAVAPIRVKASIAVLILAELGFYAAFAAQYHPALKIIKGFDDPIITTTVAGMLSDQHFSKYTERLSGTKQEPLSFLLFAQNDAQLIAAFRKAGWYLADNISLRSTIKVAQAVLLNTEDLTAPLIPSFWNARVHDFGFQKPTAAQTARQRHHARFWRTPYQTAEGKQAYVGTASLDIGIKWGVAHKISPAIDTEREVLFTDFQNAGLVENFQKEPLVAPTFGKNFLGDVFFTDGMLYVIALKVPDVVSD